MIGYVTIGANEGGRSGKFYDAVMAAIGSERKFDDNGWIGYGPKGSDAHSVYVCPPFDGKPATFGNGIMIAFNAPSQDAVRAAHEAALEAGGKDEGAPGYRPPDQKGWYGAYLRDPVGNKICVFCKG
jgi:hypothetical protein